MEAVKELPQGLKTTFEVVEQRGTTAGQKMWILKDVKSGDLYSVTKDTVNGWPVNGRRASIGPSIIVALDGAVMTALHLTTGEIYSTGAPPTGLR